MATLLYKLSSKCYKGQNNKESSSTRTSRYPWSQRKLRNSQRTLPRFGHATISHPKYGLIIYGGKYKGQAKKELFAINPANLTTSIIPSTGDPPSQRIYSALASFDNFIVLYGGEPLTMNQDFWDPSIYILDLNTNRWTRSPSNQRVGERSGHSMLASKNKFYIWGGKRSNQTFLNDLCVFQVRNGKYGDWERTTFLPGTAPLPRSNHCSILFGEKIYIFGGGNKQQLFNDVWVYDIQQKSWECVPTTGFIPSPRHYCSACLINGVMYVHGGKDELDQDLHELYGFKIKNRCWYMFQNMGRTPSARFGHTMTPVGSNLYVIGGDNVNPTTKGDDPLTIHILDNNKVSYPPDESVSPTNTISTTFSQRRTSSPILPPGDRPPSVLSNTIKTDIICQPSESTPVTSSTLGSVVHPTPSRSTPIPALVPQATPSRSSSFQATPLVSPTSCSSSQSRPVSSEKPTSSNTLQTEDTTQLLGNEKTTPISELPSSHMPTTTTSIQKHTTESTIIRPVSTFLPTNGQQHTRLSMIDLSTVPSPTPHDDDQHAKADMDYDNEKLLLLQEIKSRDSIISEMKNKEHWWRTQVAKARGIGDLSIESRTSDPDQVLDLMCFSDDNVDIHMDNNNNNNDNTKRLLFEQLVMAKAEARYIKRDIQAISKSVSMKLDSEDRLRQSALDEANHYKTLCASLLLHHQRESSTMENQGMVNTESLGGLGLYQAEQLQRATRLKTDLNKVVQDSMAMEKELATLQEEGRTNEQQRSMMLKQTEEEHIRAQEAQASYGTALKRLYFLQKRTHLDEQKNDINQHHIQLLEEQLQFVQHQWEQQQLQQQQQQQQQQELQQIEHVSPGGNLSTLIGREEETIRQWELKNLEQQETITTLKQQLTQATHTLRSLHADLKKITSDWSTVITSLKITKFHIESLVT